MPGGKHVKNKHTNNKNQELLGQLHTEENKENKKPAGVYINPKDW